MKLQFSVPAGSLLRLQVVQPARLVACCGGQCVYLAHSQQLFNGFCCGRCRLSPGTGHGPQCEMREDPRRVGAIEPKAAEPEAAGPEHAQTLTIGPVAPVEMATLGLRVVLAARAQELGAVQSCTQMDQTAGHSEVRPLDGELGTYEGRLETDLTLQLMNAVRIARSETEMCRQRAAKHEASMHTIERELRAELRTALATDNATNGLQDILPNFEVNVEKAIAFCKIIRKRDNQPKLLERCFGSAVGRQFWPLLKSFKGWIHLGRWGTLAFSIPAHGD